MISPLQIWQHPQPKHLWPALGGLSILAHIGVIGMSLPYVLTLVQSSGGPDSSAVVPIELIAADDGTQAALDLATDDERAESSLAETTRSDESVSEGDSAAFDFSSEELEEAESSTIGPTMSEYNSSQTTESPTTDPLPQPNPLGSIPSQNSQPQNSQPQSQPQDSQPPDPSSQPNSNPLPSEPAQAADAEANLPTPSQGAGEVTLNIVSAELPPEGQRYDIKETPPSFSDDSRDYVELNPETSGCDSVDFSSRTWTFRVNVNADGSAERFSPFDPVPELEREAEAIACLLQSAGFTFVPAQQDGAPIMNDDLLLTIQVQ